MKITILLAATITLANSLRIPHNPCPNIFSYFKDSSGSIYGEASVPYDGSNSLQFSVNASFAKIFNQKVQLKAHLMNPPVSSSSREKLRYNIYFPDQNTIPKITELNYNGQIYCSGPPEPVGTTGMTNVWYQHNYRFSDSRPPVIPAVDNASTNTDDDDIPFKDPMVASSGNPTHHHHHNIPENIDSREKETNNNINDVPAQHCESFTFLPLISGGSKTGEGQFPWLVAVLAYNEKSDNYEYRCTGNLISENHVMTAGRCVQFYQLQMVKTKDILFVLGKNDLSNWNRRDVITRRAKKVIVHPDFMEHYNTAEADIAIITMDNPIIPSANIRPVCLWSDRHTKLDPLVDKKGTVIGWGKEKDCREASGTLNVLRSNYVNIPVISQFDCLLAGAEYINITSDKTFCAGDGSDNGPCIGDSGAGFVFPVNGVYYLRGIASLTTPTKYSVFCDVAPYMPWIKSSMIN